MDWFFIMKLCLFIRNVFYLLKKNMKDSKFYIFSIEEWFIKILRVKINVKQNRSTPSLSFTPMLYFDFLLNYLQALLYMCAQFFPYTLIQQQKKLKQQKISLPNPHQVSRKYTYTNYTLKH